MILREKAGPRLRRSRRGFLKMVAAGVSIAAAPGIARAQFVAPAASSGRASADAPVSIEVKARPIPWFDRHDHDRVRFGALEYRSGLVLTSPFPRFGGLSGLRLDPKGERFISFNDHGHWFTGRIVYEGRTMTGLADVESAPMLGPDGKPIITRGWFDSESIAIDGSLVYIGLERVNKVLRFDFSKGFTRARGEVVPLPKAASRLPNNKGLEALVFVPRGQHWRARWLQCPSGASTQMEIWLRSSSEARRRDSSASAAPTISTSAMRCCCRPGIC